MKKDFVKATSFLFPPIVIVFVLIFIIQSCKKNSEVVSQVSTVANEPKSLKDFTQVNLVGDNDEYHPARIDANLVNGWGISFPTSGPAWVSAEGTGKSLVLNGDGTAVGISPVTIPGVGSAQGHPTGQVFNAGRGFKLPNHNPARFIFAGADGTISGWNGGATAVQKVDDSPDASYLGIALARNGNDSFLYVANFAEKKIDVYDTAWAEVDMDFTDPALPSDYSPFNVQTIDNKLYVMYAKLGPDGDEIHHPGFGIIDIYNTNGSLNKRFVTYGQLNSPWGIAKPPAGFWGDGADVQDVILVGNFGDGRINAYDMNGNFLGQLRSHGNPIEIEGLWGIMFAPPTSTTINHNWLYFAAGPDDEEHGLFGYIKKE